jgi:hypothetical protein
MYLPVLLTDDAARDLEDIYDCIESHDQEAKRITFWSVSKKHSTACLKILNAGPTREN